MTGDIEYARQALRRGDLSTYDLTCIEALIDAKIAEALHNMTPAGDGGTAHHQEAVPAPEQAGSRGSPSPAGPSPFEATPTALYNAIGAWTHERSATAWLALTSEIAALAEREYQRGWNECHNHIHGDGAAP